MRDSSYDFSQSSPAGSQQAKELRRRLERSVDQVCPAYLRDRRDDLVQVAMMRVLDIERKSEGNRTFSSSYLWKAAYSALVDEIRRLRRRRETPLESDENDEEPGLVTTLAAEDANPERRTASRQIGRGIRACLEHLVRPRRLAVTLYLQGHSVPEAARLLEWSSKRTENLVYRGLSDLRKCLQAKGLEP